MKNTTEETTDYKPLRDKRGQRRAELSENEIPLLFLVPLIETAWAHGAIARSEKHLIFAAAREEGIDEKHFLNETLDNLLVYQPGRQFFDSCLNRIKGELSSMTVAEREAKLARLINRCREVAAAAGGNSRMDVNNFTSAEEREVLTRLVAELNFREESPVRREQFAFSPSPKTNRIISR
jgi:hypothetical protein